MSPPSDAAPPLAGLAGAVVTPLLCELAELFAKEISLERFFFHYRSRWTDLGNKQSCVMVRVVCQDKSSQQKFICIELSRGNISGG